MIVERLWIFQCISPWLFPAVRSSEASVYIEVLGDALKSSPDVALTPYARRRRLGQHRGRQRPLRGEELLQRQVEAHSLWYVFLGNRPVNGNRCQQVSAPSGSEPACVRLESRVDTLHGVLREVKSKGQGARERCRAEDQNRLVSPVTAWDGEYMTQFCMRNSTNAILWEVKRRTKHM